MRRPRRPFRRASRAASGDAGAGQPAPARHHLARLIAVVAGWVVVVPLAALAGARVVAWDDLEPLVIANALTPFLYLPAWPVALLAFLGRRRVLGLVASAVVAAQIAFVAPEVLASRPVPSWARTAVTIRLVDANVYFENEDDEGYAAVIARERAELVTLEEATPYQYQRLERAGAFEDLPHRFKVPTWDPSASVIASRFPLRDTNVVWLAGRPLVVQTTVDLPGAPFRLWVVHAVAPVPSSWRQWSAQLAKVAALLRAEGTANLLVVGDFNATWYNKAFRAILGEGVGDAAAALGRPFLMTWSQLYAPIPPFVRIDHVLTGDGVSATEIGAGHGPGSDHRFLTATVAVRARARTPG